ncbi:[Fe-Fe] hydrogenase large subunit C-terminal domain-containing protein [Lentimicrobium sp. S6]|uniref:[Fe-Fe] hydrogenase large subunit C-terminal domain-containing protein n=1 Tax=Lentimicrobium sp. S6 TaxID=2735872 RepID=UPI0015556233|nr:[Fe-Fe] hydrogenase large subunit C-terminal domain-containing protein [Lentimicrobium sp. S6]NPD47018.1 4Fe-4S binding protein [Lentimicrobium sp. S6]
MILQSIYTEKNNCQDCYKCVRRCPVKAIKIEDHSASIITELCINCGYCTTICPAGAKKIRNDVAAAKNLFNSGQKVIAAFAPAWVSEFSEHKASSFISALKQLGFHEVSEVALGAEMVSESVNQYLNQQETGLHISSCCPTVVSLIQKYYPEHIDKVVPIMSPMLAHAAYLRSLQTEPIKIVFIGPCIAKKNEAEEHEGLVDVSITFQELSEWLEKESAYFEESETEELFYPNKAADGSLYPVDGGMINSLKSQITTVDLDFMSFSGRNSVKDVLENLEGIETDKLCFLELLSCNGGCVNGPGCSENNSIAKKRANIIRTHQQTSAQERMLKNAIEISLDYEKSQVNIPKHSGEDILESLKSIGKLSSKDELNCSGCGYENCRDFAEALLEEKAESSMCVSYMRKVAQNKASVLLQKMPYAVVMCDDKLKIIESNLQFAEMLGEETCELFNDIPGLEGAHLKAVFPPYKLFQNAIKLDLEKFDKDIRIEGKLYHLSIFTIQKHKIICGILRNLQSPEVRNEEVIKRTKEVILENLSTVQQVAFLLGENAAKTETMLNTIVQSYEDSENV